MILHKVGEKRGKPPYGSPPTPFSFWDHRKAPSKQERQRLREDTEGTLLKPRGRPLANRNKGQPTPPTCPCTCYSSPCMTKLTTQVFGFLLAQTRICSPKCTFLRSPSQPFMPTTPRGLFTAAAPPNVRQATSSPTSGCLQDWWHWNYSSWLC